MPTFWRGEKGTISLTFDDGPDPEVTPRVLDVLREEGVKGSFFVIGRIAEKHPELVQKIVDEGHVVGNHTYNHDYVFSKGLAEKQVSEGQADGRDHGNQTSRPECRFQNQRRAAEARGHAARHAHHQRV